MTLGLPPSSAFFRVPLVVARIAKAYKVIALQGKLRVIVQMFDVMHRNRRTYPTITLAVLALVSIPSQNHAAFVPPCLRFVKV